MKNNLKGNNSRVNEAENQISDLEHKEAKTNQSEQEEKKTKGSISSFWDNLKRSNILHQKGSQKEKRKSKKLEIHLQKYENFPNLVKEIDMHIQEAQRVPNRSHAKRPTPRHIIIKMPKVKMKRES